MVALTEDACFCSLPGFYKRPEQGIFVRLKGMITLVQIQSLMRAVINFYSFNNGNASVVITRVKEHDIENMFMARLEDIRSLGISAKEAMKNGNIEQAEKLMNQVINSMGAFIDAQLILSNLPGNINFVKTKDIIKSYIDSLEENNKVSDYEKGYLIDSIKEIMNNIEKSNWLTDKLFIMQSEFRFEFFMKYNLRYKGLQTWCQKTLIIKFYDSKSFEHRSGSYEHSWHVVRLNDVLGTIIGLCMFSYVDSNGNWIFFIYEPDELGIYNDENRSGDSEILHLYFVVKGGKAFEVREKTVDVSNHLNNWDMAK